MEGIYSTPPQKSKLDEYVKMGLLRSQTNEAGTLTIYVYTELTQFERLWNSVTRQARGLVLDNKSRCVIRCMPKFFNSDEPEARLEKPQNFLFPMVQDKLDGSLIQVANDPEYGLVVTSKASFSSDQAIWARQIIEEQYPEHDEYFASGLTYIFELIHPENRIVLDYGDRRELMLLAVIETDTGKERDVYTNRFLPFHTVETLDSSVLNNVNSLNRHGLREGVVANFGGYRVKMKTDEYVRLHRIVTEFTPKRVWEAMSTGASLEFSNMPEEFQAWLDATIEELNLRYAELRAHIDDEFEAAKELTDKELGLSNDFKYKGFIFMLRRGKDVAPGIWKAIKPKKEEVIDEKTVDA